MPDQNALIIRGEDGEVYFLGHNDLARFRLSSETAAAVTEALDEAESEDDAEVAGFALRGVTGRRVHGEGFSSIVYAPVMRGFDHSTATTGAFRASVPPDR